MVMIDGRWRRVVAVLALAMVPVAAAAQARIGPEIAVNAYTTGDQTPPAIAAAHDGSFVVVWKSDHLGAGDDVFARRYDAAGTPDGPEFRVNTYVTGDQLQPTVASSLDGDFVVAWRSNHDGDLNGVFAQRFNSLGAAQDAEFRVNGYTTGSQGYPAVAMDADGGFVVAWAGARNGDTLGVSGRRFNSSGVPMGSDFAVNANTFGGQQRPDVALTDNGEIVVVYEDVGNGLDLWARRLDASGSPLAAAFRVNTYTTDNQWFPSVAPLPGGGFVIVWDSRGQDGDGRGIYRKLYSSNAPGGFESEVRLSGHTFGDQLIPEVSADADGNFAVVWFSDGQDGSGRAAMGRHFTEPNASGAGEFLLNSYTPGSQEWPVVAMTGGGGFVAAWDSRGQDGNLGSIVAQRFAPDRIFRDGFESGDTSAWSTSATSGGDLQVLAAAALNSTGNGLQATVDDVSGRWVQDDSPEDESSYRARFYFDTNGFDPGEALNRRRVRLFVAFDADPLRRVATVILRRLNGAYALMGSVRLDDGSRYDTGFFPISDGEHLVELVWQRATSPIVHTGSVELYIDDAHAHIGGSLSTYTSGVDFVRLGAISAKPGASGTLLWDEFESRRRSYIGP
jgi:hypothetical protein